MRRLRPLILAAALVCGPALAHAAELDFTLVNRTGYQIDRVYVSPTNARQWGDEAMVQPALQSGERASIALPNCQRQCQWDLRVEFHDGQKATWSGLNLRDIGRVALSWNTRTKTTVAQPD